MIKLAMLAVCMALTAGSFAAAGETAAGATIEDQAGAIGGAFILIDQNGRTVTDEDFRGDFLLIAFGYTHCPDVCPTTLMTMASALNILGPAGKAIRPVFITLDPARDSPGRMKEYVGSFGDNFVGLTGPQPYVESVARKYHVSFSKPSSSAGDYAIDHSAGLFLVGPDGAFLRRFAYDLSAKALAAQLREAMRPATQ